MSPDMRTTVFCGHSLKLLIYLCQTQDELTTIGAAAKACAILPS